VLARVSDFKVAKDVAQLQEKLEKSFRNACIDKELAAKFCFENRARPGRSAKAVIVIGQGVVYGVRSFVPHKNSFDPFFLPQQTIQRREMSDIHFLSVDSLAGGSIFWYSNKCGFGSRLSSTVISTEFEVTTGSRDGGGPDFRAEI
jgi:hypothetical protein